MSEQRIGNYRLLARLGSGGTGTVFKAQQENLGRIVALKVLHPMYAGEVSLLTRFKREIEISAALNHPGIVRVYDAGNDEDKWYFSMEFIEGEPLRARLKREKKLPPADALQVARQLLEAMAYYHPKGLVHRDIKPENILLTTDQKVKLMDFGIVKATDKTVLTAVGSTLGTPRYMSPEMVTGEPQDHTSDIFQFGVVFYELLTGQCPFDGSTISEIAYKITDIEPGVPSQISTGLNDALDQIILRCLAKRPQDRYGSADELLEDLQIAERQVQAGRSSRLPPRSIRRPPSGEIQASGVLDRTPGAPAVSRPDLSTWLEQSVKSLSLDLVTNPRRGGTLLVLALGAIFLGFGAWFGLRPVHGLEKALQTVPGQNAILVRWVSTLPSPTEVEIIDLTHPDTRPRIFRNEEQPSALEHALTVRNLAAGATYQTRVIFPDGSRSEGISIEVPRVDEVLAKPPATSSAGSGETVITFTTHLPVRSRIRLVRAGAELTRDVSADFERNHSYSFGRLLPSEVLEDVQINLEGVDFQRELRIPAIYGERKLLDGLHMALGGLEQKENRRKFHALLGDLDRILSGKAKSVAGEDPQRRRERAVQMADGFLRESGLKDLLEGLRNNAVEIGRAEDRQPWLAPILNRIQELEDLDYLGYLHAGEPILDLADIFRPLLELSHPEESDDGLLVQDMCQDPVLNFITLQYKEKYPVTLDRQGEYYRLVGPGGINLDGVITMFRDASQYTFKVPEAMLENRSRAMMVIRVASMKPDAIFRVQINREIDLLFRNRKNIAYNFQGLFYGSCDDMKDATNDIAITFPARFLRAGTNLIKVGAESVSGITPAMGGSLGRILLRFP